MKTGLERGRRVYRRGPNPAEEKLFTVAAEHGITLTRRGYPDYVVVRDNRIVGFIEVKAKPGHRLKVGQVLFQRLCKDYGIPFCQWDPSQKLPDWFWQAK